MMEGCHASPGLPGPLMRDLARMCMPPGWGYSMRGPWYHKRMVPHKEDLQWKVSSRMHNGLKLVYAHRYPER